MRLRLTLLLALLLAVGSFGCGDDGDSEEADAGDGESGEGGTSGQSGAGGESGSAGESGASGQGGASGQSGAGGGIGDPDDEAAWTVLVYGHADHNLSNSFVRDVLEMADAEISDDVRVIVLADFDASQELAGTGETFPSGVQWLRITGGGAEPATIGEDDELDLDDPNVLAGVIATAFEQFPSEHRALILWDHGGSWQGGFGGDSQNGTRQGSPMPAPLVAEAIAAGLEAAGIDRPLDILSFDTCLMASAEVALEMQGLADVYIANAELDYGDGWDYQAFLSYLSSNTDVAVQELARTEVQQWDSHHVDASPNDTLLRSHVALDTAALPALASAIEDFVMAWSSSETLTGIELGRASYFSLPPYMNQLEQAAAEPELRDLGQFLTKMSAVSDDAVASAAVAAHDALNDAILSRSQGQLREAAMQSGVHVELPLATRLSDELLASYEQLAPSWVQSSGWLDALAIYRALDDRLPPTLATTITNGTNPDAANLPTIGLSTSDGDVAEIEVNLGVVDSSDSDTLIVFGLIAKGPVESGFDYEVAWDGQLMTLPTAEIGGLQAITVQTWEAVDADSASGMSLPPVLATFGVVTTSDGTEALGALLFQDGDAETHLLTLLDPPVTLPLADVARDLPGTTFTPIYPTISISTEQEGSLGGSPIALDEDSLPLSRGPAGAGTYALIAGVSDVFGNLGGDAQIVELSTSIE
jgi:hypothetical protein